MFFHLLGELFFLGKLCGEQCVFPLVLLLVLVAEVVRRTACYPIGWGEGLEKTVCFLMELSLV